MNKKICTGSQQVTCQLMSVTNEEDAAYVAREMEHAYVRRNQQDATVVLPLGYHYQAPPGHQATTTTGTGEQQQCTFLVCTGAAECQAGGKKTLVQDSCGRAAQNFIVQVKCVEDMARSGNRVSAGLIAH
jgi:hypothetical protein